MKLLGKTCERYGFIIHAYCLMENHYHTIVQTPEGNLSRGMQWLGVSYSAYFNTRHDRAGPLFQGRFKSVPVEDASWAYDLSLYVHLNPLCTEEHSLGKRRSRAEARGLTKPLSREEATARAKFLREYPWSSYRAYGGYEKGPVWLTTEELLARAEGNGSSAAARYRHRIRDVLAAGGSLNQSELFRDALGIGSACFIERLKELAGMGDRETERRCRLKKRVSFPQVVQAVEEVRGEPATEWLHRHGDWGKWAVLWLARQGTGMTLRELGERMGGMDYSSVCMGLRRFDQRLQTGRNGQVLQEALEQARQMLYV